MSKSYKHMSDENVQRHRDTQRGRKNKSLLAGLGQSSFDDSLAQAAWQREANQQRRRKFSY